MKYLLGTIILVLMLDNYFILKFKFWSEIVANYAEMNYTQTKCVADISILKDLSSQNCIDFENKRSKNEELCKEYKRRFPL